MGLLLAFSPFIAFVVFERLAGQTPALLAATVVSAALIARDRIHRKKVKVLEIGTAVLFSGLAAWALMSGSTWSIIGVRLRVDIGLLLAVLISIIVRKPFTLQYAQEERTPPYGPYNAGFIETNYVISAGWALAFAIMVGADLLLLYVPELPPAFGIGITALAIFLATRFTSWYPARMRSPATV